MLTGDDARFEAAAGMRHNSQPGSAVERAHRTVFIDLGSGRGLKMEEGFGFVPPPAQEPVG